MTMTYYFAFYSQVERRFQLPTSPGHGHGVILLVTWTLAFIFANLSLLSVNQHEWFFHLETIGDKAYSMTRLK